ncbi:MAG: response regulator [Nitrospirae bacterium]|nr:MAG: response regulator [Nitrospirota bacterium]
MIMTQNSRKSSSIMPIMIKYRGYAWRRNLILCTVEFDIVLTDIQMPEQSGFDLLSDLQSCFPNLPVVVMTGHADLDIIIQAFRGGAGDFIIKPVKQPELSSIIEKLIVRAKLKNIAEERRIQGIVTAHKQLLTILDNLDALVYVADMETYEVLYCNRATIAALGDVVGKTCWKSLQSDQDKPCDFCTNSRIVDAGGNPTGVYVWEFENTKNKDWFLIHDQAIRWVDNRIVRLEIATNITSRKLNEEELKASRKQLRAFALNLEAIREEERTRISREIHDVLAQALTVLKFDLSDCLFDMTEKFTSCKEPFSDKLIGMLKFIDGMIESVQNIAMGLRPSILDDIGLVAALEWQAAEFSKRTGIACKVKALADINIDKERSTTLYRIFQEALTNVARHSSAGSVVAELSSKDNDVVFSIQDDGRGITAEELSDPRSLGLLGIRERAELYGGRAIISGNFRTGTRVYIELPLLKLGNDGTEDS